ncbi:MAG: hypothetical protein F6K10_42345 [Moorea sp. SIO2B7]|nr:hypothetical protein [Moorena sp. SIO2B7]
MNFIIIVDILDTMYYSELNPNLERELTEVIRLLGANKWPFRLHATYNESISRFLNVFETFSPEIPWVRAKN